MVFYATEATPGHFWNAELELERRISIEKCRELDPCWGTEKGRERERERNKDTW